MATLQHASGAWERLMPFGVAFAEAVVPTPAPPPRRSRRRGCRIRCRWRCRSRLCRRGRCRGIWLPCGEMICFTLERSAALSHHADLLFSDASRSQPAVFSCVHGPGPVMQCSAGCRAMTSAALADQGSPLYPPPLNRSRPPPRLRLQPPLPPTGAPLAPPLVRGQGQPAVRCP